MGKGKIEISTSRFHSANVVQQKKNHTNQLFIWVAYWYCQWLTDNTVKDVLFRNFSAGIFLEPCCIKLVIFFADLDWTRSAISTQILVRIQPCTAVLFRNQQQSVLKHIVHNHSSTNGVACTQIWSLSQLIIHSLHKLKTCGMVQDGMNIFFFAGMNGLIWINRTTQN